MSEFQKVCDVHICVEKNNSSLVPYSLIFVSHLDLEPEEPSLFRDDISLIETEHISLPKFDFSLEVGDRIEFKADFYARYYSYWTDCGTEHDAEFYFDKVKDILIWRVVGEPKPKPEASDGE